IIKKHYPNDEHVFVYNNATIHAKCKDGTPSTSLMPKNPSSGWGVWDNDVDANGKPQYGPDRKKLKKIQMTNGKFANGRPQSFYFADDYELVRLHGYFKGTKCILEEQGY
ncbi:hypothetical protein GYMLUDRAFT_128853, partial [Collybiopsis luxurians FD-317 M1]